MSFVVVVDHLLRPGQAVMHLQLLLQQVECELLTKHSTQDPHAPTHRPLALPIAIMAFSKGGLVLNTLLSELATVIHYADLDDQTLSRLADAPEPARVVAPTAIAPAPANLSAILHSNSNSNNHNSDSNSSQAIGKTQSVPARTSSPAPFFHLPQVKNLSHHMFRSAVAQQTHHTHSNGASHASAAASCPIALTLSAPIGSNHAHVDDVPHVQLLDWESDQVSAHIQFEPAMRITRSCASRSCVTELLMHRTSIFAFFHNVFEVHWLDCHRFPTEPNVVRALALYTVERFNNYQLNQAATWPLSYRLHTTPRQLRDRRCPWIALEHDYFVAFLKDGIRTLLAPSPHDLPAISPRSFLAALVTGTGQSDTAQSPNSCSSSSANELGGIPPLSLSPAAIAVPSASASSSSSSVSAMSSASTASSITSLSSSSSSFSSSSSDAASPRTSSSLGQAEQAQRTGDKLVVTRMYLERERPSLMMHFRILDLFVPPQWPPILGGKQQPSAPEQELAVSMTRVG
jgi:hypothetical protein